MRALPRGMLRRTALVAHGGSGPRRPAGDSSRACGRILEQRMCRWRVPKPCPPRRSRLRTCTVDALPPCGRATPADDMASATLRQAALVEAPERDVIPEPGDEAREAVGERVARRP